MEHKKKKCWHICDIFLLVNPKPSKDPDYTIWGLGFKVSGFGLEA